MVFKMNKIALVLSLVCLGVAQVFGSIAQPDSLKKAQVDSLLAIGAGTLSVNAPTKDEIRDFVKRNAILENGIAPAKYSTQPRTKAPLAQGTLSSEFMSRGINAINVVRYVAGVDSDVKLNEAGLDKCQQAALMCAASKIDKQGLKCPEGMDRELYKNALETYSNAVVAVGGESLDRTILFNMVKGSGKDVMADVCSRRQVLNPQLEQVAFGHVGKYALLQPTLKSSELPIEQIIVAWPAQNTPLDYFDISSPLSLMFSADYDIKGNVILVMVRLNDGKMWKFGRLLPKQDGFYSTSSKSCGLPGCITWKPDLDQYRANDQFSIHVSGVKFRGVELPTIEYRISFFNLFTVFVNGYLKIMEPVSTVNGADYKGNQEITSIDIASSVKNIDNSAFAGCIKLERIGLPQSIETISGSMFKGCVALEKVELPNTVTLIETDAFAGCSAMARLGISYKLKTIESGAFKGCTALTSFDLPESLQEIGTNAFAGCSGLTKIQIPLNVTRIGVGAFSGCTSLKEITFAEAGNSPLDLQAHVFQGCVAIDSIAIPSSVRAINEYAFDGCTSLKVIHIAEGVKKIAENAFAKTALQRIYIPSSVECIGRVSAIPTTAIIYCKAGSYAEKWAKGLYRKYQLIP